MAADHAQNEDTSLLMFLMAARTRTRSVSYRQACWPARILLLLARLLLAELCYTWH